jgi:hypothetical protein
MINTLKYAKKLEEAGFSRQQAEANIQIIAEIVEDDVATKQDLKHLETHLDSRIKDLDTKLSQLEFKIVFRLSTIVGVMITLAIAVTTAVAKFL